MEDFSQPSTSFDLKKLPHALQRTVVEKLTFKDFRELRIASKCAFSLCESVHSDFVAEANWLRITSNGLIISPGFCSSYNFDQICTDQCAFAFWMITVEISLDKDDQKELLEMFRERKMTTSIIEFSNRITCSGFELMDLCEIVEATELRCNEEISPSFTSHPFSSKLTHLALAVCMLNDQQFLSISPRTIDVFSVNVSADGIVKLLKEWMIGEREIDRLSLSFNSDFDYAQVAEELKLTVVWTPTWHDYSLVKTIPLADTAEAQSLNPQSYYCLWRPNRIRDIYILTVNSSFLIFLRNNISNTLARIVQ